MRVSLLFGFASAALLLAGAAHAVLSARQDRRARAAALRKRQAELAADHAAVEAELVVAKAGLAVERAVGRVYTALQLFGPDLAAQCKPGELPERLCEIAGCDREELRIAAQRLLAGR